MAKSVATDQTAVRLHVGKDGLVWYGDDSCLAENSFLDPDNFLCSQGYVDWEKANDVRVLGTKDNAKLIIGLSTMLRRRRLNTTIQMGHPCICPTKASRDKPQDVLHYLWRASPSGPSPGGWHPITFGDHCTYTLIMALDECGDNVDDRVRTVVRYHPAWPVLSFIPTLNEDFGCKLLAEMVDPLWFSHSLRSGRHTRLFAHFGLSLTNVTALFDDSGEHAVGRNIERAVIAISTWYHYQAKPTTGFLWRIYEQHVASDDVRGVLIATQCLLELIWWVWFTAVASPHPELTFKPELFFKDGNEATAFQRHCARVVKKV
ncbi:MAG: hypothetical protein L0312_20030 [Acidobacteria bacterium]|nr:hypothetical protein [Acidobacteriota bacterium]